jgi:hypothetical protein
MSALTTYDEEELTLTEVAEYVALVTVHLKRLGHAEPQQLVDAYSETLLQEWLLEGGPPPEAAKALIVLAQNGEPPAHHEGSLFVLAFYVKDVVKALEGFGFAREDAAEVVDDFDDDIAEWCPELATRTAARRLAGRQRGLHAG